MDAGMKITSQEDVEKALKSIGFYRLRGYSFQLYDNAAKKYVPGTKFEDIIKLYQFDQELSALVFSMISKIEVALRVRLVEALLIHGEPLVLQDSSIFKEKKRYWQNMAREEYAAFDYIICMERYNIQNIMRIIGNDPEHKVQRLLDYTNRPRDIADPWYTGNFDETFDDVMEGCQAFLSYLMEHLQ